MVILTMDWENFIFRRHKFYIFKGKSQSRWDVIKIKRLIEVGVRCALGRKLTFARAHGGEVARGNLDSLTHPAWVKRPLVILVKDVDLDQAQSLADYQRSSNSFAHRF